MKIEPLSILKLIGHNVLLGRYASSNIFEAVIITLSPNKLLFKFVEDGGKPEWGTILDYEVHDDLGFPVVEEKKEITKPWNGEFPKHAPAPKDDYPIPHRDKPGPWIPHPHTPPYSNNIICQYCGQDSGIPQILGMYIPPEGLRCRHCGQVLVMGTQIWCSNKVD